MLRHPLPILALLLASCVTEMDDDVDIAESEQEVDQAEWSVGGFTVRLHQNGAYDMPLVLIEGFDPNDEFKASSYWNWYPNYRGQMMPPLLGTQFPAMLEARGYDVWIVSAQYDIAADYISTNGWRYGAYVHPFIMGWGVPYVLAGHSAGGLVARYALSYYIDRVNTVRAYISFDAPHEGANVPRSLMMYMLDHATCNKSHFTSNGFTDPLSCHTRYVTRGIASGAASDLLRTRMYPTCGPSYWKDGQYYSWPSFWNDCKDLGGCSLMQDGRWNKCNDTSGGWIHGNYAWYIKGASDWNYLGWFTDIPRYAISQGGADAWPGTKTVDPAYILENDVNNAGNHHLYTDAWQRDCVQWYGAASSQCAGYLQVRGSKDGFMDRLDEVGDGGFFDWRLHKKGNFTFVTMDSAFGANSGLSWNGRLVGQCNGNQGHDAVTTGSAEYIVDIMNQTYKGYVEFRDPNGDRRPRDCDCGDGYCGGYENVWSCGVDCGYCGDYICSGYEDQWSCPSDCGGYCGDYVCGPGEDQWNCSYDCGGGGGGYCGDWYCDWSIGEDQWSCPNDCGYEY
jgi:hypothetical protein